jgi:hypothetical protein
MLVKRQGGSSFCVDQIKYAAKVLTGAIFTVAEQYFLASSSAFPSSTFTASPKTIRKCNGIRGSLLRI